MRVFFIAVVATKKNGRCRSVCSRQFIAGIRVNCLAQVMCCTIIWIDLEQDLYHLRVLILCNFVSKVLFQPFCILRLLSLLLAPTSTHLYLFTISLKLYYFVSKDAHGYGDREFNEMDRLIAKLARPY